MWGSLELGVAKKNPTQNFSVGVFSQPVLWLCKSNVGQLRVSHGLMSGNFGSNSGGRGRVAVAVAGAMGRMAGWPDGRVAGWPGGRMAGWPGGRMAAWLGGQVGGWAGVAGWPWPWPDGRMAGWPGFVGGWRWGEERF